LRAAAIQHVLFEDLGLIEPVLLERGYEIERLEAGIDELGESPLTADLLVVLGGPIGVGDSSSYEFLEVEKKLIGDRLAAGRPTLGICLGAQLMASALGAEVRPTGRTEIGFGELTLTDEGRSSVLSPLEGIPVLHWHGDEFLIPEGADRLASTDGFPNQAFSFGRTALALQFHIETDPALLERWLIGHSGELHSEGIDPRDLREQASRIGPRLSAAARAVLERWLDEA